MTLASTLLRTMESTLRARLGEAAAEVRIHDGDPGVDPKNVVRGKDPLVLVTCLGANVEPDGYSVADGVFAAFVFTRANTREEGEPLSRGITAANLAFLVAAIVEQERWGGLSVRRASRIRLRNEHAERNTKDLGWAIWSVLWTQPFEVEISDVNSFGRLGSIHYTFAMGDELTPDAYATVEFPPVGGQ